MESLVKTAFAFVLALAACSTALASEDARLVVVERLYQDYAWETGHEQTKRETFFNERRAVLERYLTRSLANLVVEDQECSRRTREICQLDFSPIWDSQDPEGAKFRILSARPDNVVVVNVSYPGRKPRSVMYYLTKTDLGWRIDDIRTSKWSLRIALKVK